LFPNTVCLHRQKRGGAYTGRRGKGIDCTPPISMYLWGKGLMAIRRGHPINGKKGLIFQGGEKKRLFDRGENTRPARARKGGNSTAVPQRGGGEGGRGGDETRF